MRQVETVITQTLWMGRIRIRAYTLIEMMVVCVILGMFAAEVVPSYINMLNNQKRRAFYTESVDFAGKAHELAVTHSATMYLAADSAESKLLVKMEKNDTSFQAADGGTGNTGPTTTSNGQSIDTNSQANIGTFSNDRSQDPIMASIPMSPGMQFGNFQLDGQPSDSTSWKVRFFRDGSCDGGAVELSDHGVVKSLVVDANGNAKLVDGSIPDASQQSWPAGNYVQRQQ